MIRPGPVLLILGKPVATRLALLLALVVAVFLAESFTTLMEEALQFGGSPADVAVLLAFKAPEIIDLALAIGLLIALYFSLAEARNRGELVILAFAGVRWSRIVFFVAGIGLAGGVLSFCIAGIVVPSARFAERVKMADIRSDHVLDQISRDGPRGSVLSIAEATFIATPPATKASGDRGQLFVFQTHPDHSWRVIQAQDWTVERTPSETDPELRRVVLRDLQAFDGARADAPSAISAFRTNEADLSFSLSDVAPKPEIAMAMGERALRFSREDERRIADVATRALLVPTAALLAIAAVLAGGTGLARFVTLPLAVAGVMAYDVLGRMIVGDALGTVPAVRLAGWVLLAYFGPITAYILWRGEALMIPDRGK